MKRPPSSRRPKDSSRRFPQRSGTPRKGWVRAIREALGMSQAQLAARAGVSRATVQKLELAEARRRITLDSLDRLASALGCRLAVALVPNGGSLDAVRTEAANVKAEAMLVSATQPTTGSIADAIAEEGTGAAPQPTAIATTGVAANVTSLAAWRVATDVTMPAVEFASPEMRAAVKQQIVASLLDGSPRKLWR